MKYKLTKQILDTIGSKFPENLEQFKQQGWISHNDLVCLIKSSNESFLKDLSVYKDQPVQPPKSPEFLKHMQQLRAKQQEQEYQRMVAPVSGTATNMSFSKEAKEVKHQITTIINILISVVSVAYALWYWTGSVTIFNDASRVLIALFGAILVLVAEVVVFGGYLRRVDEAKQRERSKKEVRKVIESVTLTKKMQ